MRSTATPQADPKVNAIYLVNDVNLTSVSSPVKPRPSGHHHGDLRNALEQAALELVAEKGPHGFSLNEASRRAGVSVAAPYKHFADREALLAALAETGYREQRKRFAAAVESDSATSRQISLAAFAAAYVRFAAQEPALFDVTFYAGLDEVASSRSSPRRGIPAGDADADRGRSVAADETVRLRPAAAHLRRRSRPRRLPAAGPLRRQCGRPRGDGGTCRPHRARGSRRRRPGPLNPVPTEILRTLPAAASTTG